MPISRRSFLAASGLGAAALVTGLGTELAFAQNTTTTGDKLVVLFLGGGADGLTFAPPYGIASYYDQRPTLAIPGPNEQGGALPLTSASSNNLASFPSGLDGVFGLHPLLKPLHTDLWAKGKLALVAATGLPGVARSHFRAIPKVEQGSMSGVSGGWLARLMQAKGNPSKGSLQAVHSNGANNLVRGLTPKVGLIDNMNNFGIKGFSDQSLATAALRSMHSNDDDVSRQGTKLIDTLGTLENLEVANKGYPKNAYGNAFAELATLFKADLGVEAAAIKRGGWDYHRNHAARFKRTAPGMANAITAFAKDTDGLKGITLLVITEFGRTVKENGNKGTDHGQGFTALVMGDGVKGGVYGDDHPTDFNDQKRSEIPIITDYRKILSELAVTRVGIEQSQLETVFPGYKQDNFLGLV